MLPSNKTIRNSSIAWLTIVGLACGVVFPIAAQDQSGAPQPSDLNEVERDLAREQQARDETRRLAEQAAAEAVRLQTAMVEAAQRIQDRESTLTALEGELADLERRRAEMAEELARKDDQMRDVLLALERLAIRPTDALMLQPLKPADAVRSGLVLAAAIPAITENAAKLKSELEVLYRTRMEIVERRSAIAATAATLLEEQNRLESLYAEKAARQEGLEQQVTDSEARIATLAKEADDLRDLLNRVVAERARQKEEEAKQAALKAPVLTAPDGAAPSLDIVEERRPKPPIVERSFSGARGTLPFPVMGRLARRYGEATDVEGRSKGIVINSRPEAQVVSPFDGTIAFAGPFRGYGQLLIMEHSEGYHTLLAGMSRLDGRVGQRVLAGEPVGVMSPEGDPSLYVELRRDGQPINPLPWLAARTDENSG